MNLKVIDNLINSIQATGVFLQSIMSKQKKKAWQKLYYILYDEEKGYLKEHESISSIYTLRDRIFKCIFSVIAKEIANNPNITYPVYFH